MESAKVFTTVRDVEDFLISYFQRTGMRPTLPEVFSLMNESRLLHSAPKLKPSGVPHTIDELRSAINSQVIDGSLFLTPSVTPAESTAAEEDAEGEETSSGDAEKEFPQGRDVVITRHFPYLNTQPRSHSYFEIFVVLSGASEVYFDGSPVFLEEGDVLIVPPHTQHILAVNTNSFVFSIDARRSTFDAQFGDMMANNDVMSIFFRDSLYGSHETNYFRLKTDLMNEELFGTLCVSVHEAMSPSLQLSNMCATSLLKVFLALAFRMHSETIQTLRTIRDDASRVDCGEILQYIQHNYRTVQLSTLARTFHYNETYLSRRLQNVLNQSFTEIVRGIKMTHAEDYLLNSNLRIHEISALVGYESVDHFSRTFKATHGISPQAFRHQAPAAAEEKKKN